MVICESKRRRKGIKLIEIHQTGENGVRLAVSCTVLVEGDSPRQVSLADSMALSAARKLQGLCVRKFDADLVTEGVELDALYPGCRLHIGEAEIEISSEKKRCFEECALRQRGETCPLPRNVAFARTVSGGQIEKGADIKKENK